MESFMEIFTLVTGVIYIILEIRQKNFMWVVGILTSVAAMWVFFRQGLYASFALNAYYLVTSFIGLWQWGRAKMMLKQTDDAPGQGDDIHLNRLTLKTIAVSTLVVVAGTFVLSEVMAALENPMSVMDASVAVLSAVATWWLVRSYLEQWWLWIIADALSTIMCATQGLWWMTALYAAYSLSAVYGYIHWKRNGRYIE
ncbi:MAG: nicotinamide mononucleotide transporter [Bacteroidales bacterium]|nr:nicotinamide mononucleotide transporter [Bacteroidales bacterium]